VSAASDRPSFVTKPSELTKLHLLAGLRAWAKSVYPSEASVELLIRHDDWLRRPEFIDRALWVSDDGPVQLVGIDVPALIAAGNDSGASSSESRMLAIAASLLGADLGSPLSEVLHGLDDANANLVLNAVAHSLGWHERSTAAAITGRFPD
jgi:hypothetical protein